MITRDYNCSDVAMLTAGRIIVKSLSDHLDELGLLRTNWTPEFVTAMDTEINVAEEDYLGKDVMDQLREATATVKAIAEPAEKALMMLKIQIEVDFGKEAKAILKTLGYPAKMKNLDQESLVELLFAFSKGLTNELKTQILEKGTPETLLNQLLAYGTTLNEANVTQESLKGNTPEMTQEAIAVFNGIYTKIIGICKIAQKYYEGNASLKKQFAFSRVVKRMGSKEASSEAVEEV